MATDLHRGTRHDAANAANAANVAEDRAVVAGLDRLESSASLPAGPSLGRRFVRSALPPVLFLAALVGVWQLGYVAKLKPAYALPGSGVVAQSFSTTVQGGRAAEAIWTSLSRG